MADTILNRASIQRPTSSIELAEIVRAAAQTATQVQITGSNSLPLSRFDQSRPIQNVSTLRMNKVLEHAVADMTIIVQAGISLEALQRHLAWHNQWLPVDSPVVSARAGMSPGQRTIGGLIATHSLGPLRFGCGDWRLLLMGMQWVDGTGTLIKGGGRTVKNVAGYNTPRMMIGTCGTLGTIAEITLRTFARPIDEQCVIFFCDGSAATEALLAEVMTAPTTPAYVQIIGGATFSINPLQLPTMRKGMALVVGFFDRPQSCAAQIDIIRALPAAHGVDSISQTAAQAGRLRLWMTTEPAIESFKGTTGFGFRLFVLSSEVCAAVTKIETLARRSDGEAWVVSEAGTGVVRGVISGTASAALARAIEEVAPGAEFLVTQGKATDERGEEAGGGVGGDQLMMRIKAQLDPHNIFGQPPAR